MEISIQIANIGPNDLGTLSKVFGILQGSGIEVTTTSGSSAPTPRPPKAAPAAAPQAPAPAPAQAAKKSAPAPAPQKKKAPAAAAPAPAPAVAGPAEDNYSRYTRNNPAMYSAADRKSWDPVLEKALKEYHAAAGSRAQGGRTIKNWSINRLRQEAAALGGAPADAEGSPSPKSSARGRPAAAGKKAVKVKRKK